MKIIKFNKNNKVRLNLKDSGLYCDSKDFLTISEDEAFQALAMYIRVKKNDTYFVVDYAKDLVIGKYSKLKDDFRSTEKFKLKKKKEKFNEIIDQLK